MVARLWLQLGLAGISLSIVGAALVACAVEPAQEAPAGTDRPVETPAVAGESGEGGISVESGQSEPGAPEAGSSVDLNAARQQIREEGGGFWTYLDAPGAAGEQTYRVDAGEQLRAALTVGNYQENAVSLALTCIVDLVQTPCVEGTSDVVQRVELNAQEDTTLPVRLPRLSEGLHDVMIALFMYPDDHSTDGQFRADTRFMYAYDRITLYVGESRVPPSLESTVFAEPDALATQGMHLYTVNRHSPGQSEEAWHLEELRAGEHVAYDIVRNNPESRTVTYAFLGFLDYEQVPISADRMVFYAQVEGHAIATASGDLVAPNEPGEHEFLVLAVDNPYLDQAAELTSSSPLWADTYTSDRVLIRVE